MHIKLITEVTEDVKLITEANKAGEQDYFTELYENPKHLKIN